MTGWSKNFSYNYYRYLVHAACVTLTPRLFREVPTLSPTEGHVLLRHDIDCSLKEAVQLAEFEQQLGVRASYYVMMHSLLYDVRQSSAVREIAAMGHEVGVHFDLPSHCDQNNRTLVETLINEDCERLEDVLGEAVTSLSFHRPIQQFLRGPLFLAGRVNAYAAELMEWYISDSRGAWRCGEPLLEIEEKRHRTLQLLTHPIWWGPSHMVPADRLQLLFFRLTRGKNLRQRALIDAQLVQTMPGIRRNGFYLPESPAPEWQPRPPRPEAVAGSSPSHTGFG